jgi:cytochrome P450
LFGDDPHVYNPGRFIDTNGRLKPALYDTKDEHHVTFGFGRRICVGKYVGNDSLFIDIATLVWAMDIQYTGKEKIDLDGYVDEGIVM